MSDPAAPSADAFVSKWSASGGAETANSQSFLTDLCDLLGVPRPDPTVPEEAENRYAFERAVTRVHGDGKRTTNFLDLYKAGCFVLESKQGADAPAGPAPLSAEKAAGARKSGTARRKPKIDVVVISVVVASTLSYNVLPQHRRRTNCSHCSARDDETE